MKRILYLLCTILSAIYIAGCSRPITVSDLSAIQEAEDADQNTIPTVSIPNSME